MIRVVDNFLDKTLYEEVYNNLMSNEFVEVQAGNKSFWIQQSTPEFDNIIINSISVIENRDRQNIFSFFRVATDEVDTDWRIHSDAIINGQRPERALVLYLSTSEMEGLHGTAFWKHKELGKSLPSDVSFEEYDKILESESNIIDKWNLHSVIGYEVNRGVMYPCNYFHSKYPNVGWESGRIVYVMFYK